TDTFAIAVIDDGKEAGPTVFAAPDLRQVDAPQEVGVIHLDASRVRPAGGLITLHLHLETMELHQALDALAVDHDGIFSEAQQRPDSPIPVLRESGRKLLDSLHQPTFF